MNLFHISVLKSPLVHRLLVNRKQDVAIQSQFLAAFLSGDSAVMMLLDSRLFSALFGVACCFPGHLPGAGSPFFGTHEQGDGAMGGVGSAGTELCLRWCYCGSVDRGCSE